MEALRAELAAQRTEVARLRERLDEQQAAQRAEATRQRERFDQQQAALDQQSAAFKALLAKLEAMAPSPSVASAAPAPAPSPTPAAAAEPKPEPKPEPVLVVTRDSVGDLNRDAIAEGDFPGSIMIPGSRNVSLAVGGFVKLVGMIDSDLEGTGAIFTAANIGGGRPDEKGNASLDATLTRLHLDAQAPVDGGRLHGYVEWDYNDTNNGALTLKMRHIYGAWETARGTLTAGHTWSTGMDLQILPEGMTEPTVSGAFFNRQAMVRWSQPVSDGFSYDLALEDGSSSDLVIESGGRGINRFADIVGALEWDKGKQAHLRVTGLVRPLHVVNTDGRSDDAMAWNLSAGAHVLLGNGDKLTLGANYGEGVGRYLLGLPPAQAGFYDAGLNEVDLLRAGGVLAGYRHAWNEKFRTTLAYGAAWVDDTSWQSADAFDASRFGLVNLMWSPVHYVTLGTELQYGERKDKSGESRSNTRWILGIQVF